jgi:hypothetical protein
MTSTLTLSSSCENSGFSIAKKQMAAKPKTKNFLNMATLLVLSKRKLK